MASASDDSNSSWEDEEVTEFPDCAELTQPVPSNRASVGDSTADLQTLAHNVIRGDFGQVRRLATRQLVTSADAARRTVLMLVADASETSMHTEKCILYLFELGANPKMADANGDTAAHLAAQRDHLRLLTLLSFDAKWLRNDKGATPLMEAARTGSWKCAKHLLHLLRQPRFNESEEHGNSKRSRLLEMEDLEGRTALDLARLSGHSELAGYIEREMRLVVVANGRISGLTDQEEADRQELERLVKAGDSAGLLRAATRGSPDLPNSWGQTALMWAAMKSSCSDEALWEQLVQLGDPTCADMWAESCLQHAARAGNCVAVSALLAAGAFANARERAELTPLMWAAFLAPSDTAAAVGRVLLDSGSNWSIKDCYGMTALDLATQKGKSELAELLRGPEGPPFLECWDAVHLISRGGFSEVHEVRTDTGVKCAAKTLRLPLQLGDELPSVSTEILRAIESERNLCRLRHPNIVRFLHIAQPEPATVVVFMELLDGRSLERFIHNKPLDELTIRDFSKQICRALLYLHSRQPPVIHRDINCSNIIVCADNTRIKLIDFGLSIKLEQSVSHILASTQSPKGTPNFMAPELLGAGESDSVQCSRESDIWAFGCSVFQMASGERPFANARNFLEMAQLIGRSGAPALPDGRSAELRDFYSRCTAKEHKERNSAQQLLEHEFLTAGKCKEEDFASRFLVNENE
uniref:Protein kinase domain-containing protein n=1 Tax=Macrostomum lignano TaxID=282301 RepID=A0A1I8GIA2_9PLAT